MAKKSKIARNRHREALVKRYSERRQELVKIINDPETPDEERDLARRKFNNIPRDASPTRLRIRCELTGRPRGNYRKFKLSRIKFRELAHEGLLPGITKSSW